MASAPCGSGVCAAFQVSAPQTRLHKGSATCQSCNIWAIMVELEAAWRAGPFPTWMMGSMLQLRAKGSHIYHQELAKKYGPIFKTWGVGRPFIVVTSPKLCRWDNSMLHLHVLCLLTESCKRPLLDYSGQCKRFNDILRTVFPHKARGSCCTGTCCCTITTGLPLLPWIPQTRELPNSRRHPSWQQGEIHSTCDSSKCGP